MHIPDGLLDARTLAGAAVLGAAALGAGAARAGRELGERRVPFLGVMAAFIFAAQMINFPVAGGTSGHFLGAALAALTFGPGAASVVMAAVLVVQCLLLADGGLLALGANILNMAVVAPWAAWALHRAIAALPVPAGGAAARVVRGAGTFVAAWASVVAAAGAAAGQLALAGAAPFGLVMPAMLFWHAIIGIGEGTITVVALAYVRGLRRLAPDNGAAAGASPTRGDIAGQDGGGA
jgi:cobalt/nickel transport system permease protein